MPGSDYDDADVNELGERERDPNPGQEHANSLFSGQPLGTHTKKDDSDKSPSHRHRSRVRHEGEQDQKPEYGPSAYDDLNKKFTGRNKGEKTNSLRSFMGGKSSKKKKAAVLASLLGGGAVVASSLFFLLLPLKIETLLTNIETRALAASQKAISDESSNLFNRWVAKNIMPNLLKGTCHSTVSAGCVSVDNGTGPIHKVYEGWRQGRLEQKLAANHDIVIGRKGNRFYINMPNLNASITEGDARRLINGQTDIFSLASENSRNRGQRVSKNEIRQALSQSLDNETFFKRVYKRHVFGKFLEAKYGVKRCAIKCDFRDKFGDSINDKNRLAKSLFIQRVISPLSENYAYMFQCIVEGGCDGDHDPANADEEERTTPAQRKINENLAAAAARVGPESAAKIAASSAKIAEEGMGKYLASTVTSKFVGIFGGEAAGATAGKTAAAAVPVVGWIVLISQLLSAGREVGPTIQHVGYAVNSAAAAQTYGVYASAVSETHGGYTDARELGSLNEALTSNLSGSTEDRSDATSTPLYNSINNTSSGTSSASLFPLGAFAASTPSGDGSYKCADGKGVPGGQLVCKEEVLNRGNDVASGISNAVHAVLDPVPGANAAVSFVSTVANAAGSVVGGAISKVASITPGYDQFAGFIAGLAEPLIKTVMDSVLSSPFNDNMSGGRTYDMMAAGADVSHNDSCQVTLGCAAITDEQAKAIQNETVQQERYAFEQQPWATRMFSSATPYSLVSRMSLSLPGSVSNGASQVASSIMRSPFKAISSIIPRFSTVSADFGSANDPFGIPQRGYLSVPDDPDTFWEQNCVNGPLGKYDESTNKLDVSDWLNDDSIQKLDPETGTLLPSTPNACLLIFKTAISAGGMFDSSLLPKDSLIGSTDGATTTETGVDTPVRIATFNIHGASHTDEYKDRADKSIDTIRSNDIGVVGLQESQIVQRNYFVSKLTNYDYFPKGNEKTGNRIQNSIIWNKDKFKIVDGSGGYQPGLVYFCGSKLDAPYVKLEAVTNDGTTGRQFYVLNTHDPAYAKGNNCNDKAALHRYLNAKAHVAFVKQLQSQDPGVPIYYTGDFNSGYDNREDGKNGSAYVAPGTNPSATEKAKNLTYCIMTADGVMKDAYDVYKNRAVKCPNPKQAPDGRDDSGGIDHVFVTPDVKVTNWIKYPGPQIGSDHVIQIFDTIIPASSSGANGASGSTDDEGYAAACRGQGNKYSTACSGQCVDFVQFWLRKHVNPNVGSFGTGSNVAPELGRSYGFAVDNTPAVNSVVSWPNNGVTGEGGGADEDAGHVAIVIAKTDTTITVKEYNYGNPPNPNYTVKDKTFDTRVIPMSTAVKLTYAHTETEYK